VLLWVPRVLLFPLYLTSEYLVRKPLGALITTAEKNHWPSVLHGFFTFGEERKVGLYPVAYLDFGFRPSFGLRFFANDAFAQGNSLHFSAATGGSEWWRVALSDTYRLTERRSLSLEVAYSRRPDFLFNGLGPRSRDEDEVRYGAQRWELEGAYEHGFGPRASALRLHGGLHAFRYRDDTCCDQPSLGESVAEGSLPAPPGFGERYTAPFVGAELTLDTRPLRPKPQSGGRLRTWVQNAFRFEEGRNEGWVRYGGALEGFLDLTQEARVVSLGVAVEAVDPVGQREVPFVELAGPAGTGALAGFRPGRLRDRSAAAARLRYAWPVWATLDGELTFAAGNVFGRHLEGLEPGLLRLSASLGIVASDAQSGGSPFQLLVGVGTDPLDEGFRISSFRLVLEAPL
jgi:hypothetical protein